jgi:hypothetical protein
VLADVNRDGRVDQLDLAIVVSRLFVISDTPKNPNADANGDRRVTAADVAAVIGHLQ